MHRHGRLGTGQQIVARLRPRDARRRRIAREIGQFALALADLAQRPVVAPQVGQLVGEMPAGVRMGCRQPVEPRLDIRGLPAVRVAHLLLVERIAHLRPRAATRSISLP